MAAHIVVRDSVSKLVSGKAMQTRLRAMSTKARWVHGAKPKTPDFSLLLTDDAEIHSLNREYRKKNKPTDVLAFAMHEGEFGHLAGANLGDIVISVETATRQCADHKLSVLDELTTLAAHGLLHLLGWDHNTDAEETAMNQATTALVQCALVASQAKPAAKSAKAKAKPTKPGALTQKSRLASAKKR
jgi:probable rRNA maturation factor